MTRASNIHALLLHLHNAGREHGGSCSAGEARHRPFQGEALLCYMLRTCHAALHAACCTHAMPRCMLHVERECFGCVVCAS